MSHPLEVSALGDNELVMTRTFDAPPRLVFDSWTKPELLRQWLGVRGGWTMPVCEIDLRIGGEYRIEWTKEGARMGLTGTYHEIERPHRLVSSEIFDEAWYPGEALVTLTLDELGARTTATMTIRYESTEARDQVLASPMESGVAESYEVLDRLLARVGARASAATG